jgi:hypothetical protein
MPGMVIEGRHMLVQAFRGRVRDPGANQGHR